MARRKGASGAAGESKCSDAAYYDLLGIDPAKRANRTRLKAALTRAHGLRTFEIEHYWKRATYFWAFQVAIFAAFGLLHKPEATEWGPVPIFIAGLGVLTAVANWLSAKGSKFWQANWEAHIDVLEDDFEGRLHKTVAGRPNFSVSRLNETLGACFVVFWSVMFGYAVFQASPPLLPLRPIPSETAAFLWVAAAVVAVIVGVIALFAQRSGLERKDVKWRLRE